MSKEKDKLISLLNDLLSWRVPERDQEPGICVKAEVFELAQIECSQERGSDPSWNCATEHRGDGKGGKEDSCHVRSVLIAKAFLYDSDKLCALGCPGNIS